MKQVVRFIECPVLHLKLIPPILDSIQRYDDKRQAKLEIILKQLAIFQQLKVWKRD
jgi:hypothetical protein